MHKGTVTALTISGLTALGVYRYRRGLVSRLLGLPPALHDVAVERGLRIPMRDGAELVADRYYPREPGRFPTILVRTPYGRKASGLFVSRRMAERGYNVLVQDVRGRFDSEGEFDVFAGEDVDGRATIGWISNQPWFDGSLGLWGMSYLAYAQWAAAPGAPTFLRAIMPQIGGSRAYPIIYPDGAFNLDLALPYSVLIEEQNTKPNAPFLKGLLSQLRIRRRIRRGFMHLPIGEADAEVSGRPKAFFRDWLANPEADDAYWRDRDHSGRVREVEAPAHLFSGWYDFFLRELLDDYEALIAAGKTPHLRVGPYPHGSLGMTAEVLRETFAWFEAHLKGEPHKAPTKPVRLYVMGANEWREFDAWPPPPKRRASTCTPAGCSSRKRRPSVPHRTATATTPPIPPPRSADHYSARRASGAPWTTVSWSRARTCWFTTTPPLDRDTEIVEPVRLELYAASSLQHADFFGRLCDVHPDGKSINVCDGLFRMEPGEGEQHQDGSSRLEIDMWATAYPFRRGHSIRLQVSGGAHLRWNRNLGTGEPIAKAKTMLAADQTVYHDREHPSAVILPVSVLT